MKLRRLLPFLIMTALIAGLIAVSTYNRSGSKTPRALNSKELRKNLTTTVPKILPREAAMSERKLNEEKTLLMKERQYTEEEINQMTEEEFTLLLQETEKKLPKVADIRALPPEALHHTPPPIIQAGRDLGLIKEILQVHESYERMAMGLYQNCAKDALVPTPVRALCLTNLIPISKKNGEPLSKKDYPRELWEMSKMVSDF